MGMKIIESPYIVDRVEETQVIPWRARLLSWPWRPWVSTRTVTIDVPSLKVIQLNQNTVVMHPVKAMALRQLRQLLAGR